MRQHALPSIPDILNSAATSTWLRTALQGVLFGGRDPFAAAQDARLLAEVLCARAQAQHGGRGLDYYDGSRPPMVDLELPIVEADGKTEVTISTSVAPRSANFFSLRVL